MEWGRSFFNSQYLKEEDKKKKKGVDETFHFFSLLVVVCRRDNARGGSREQRELEVTVCHQTRYVRAKSRPPLTGPSCPLALQETERKGSSSQTRLTVSPFVLLCPLLTSKAQERKWKDG